MSTIWVFDAIKNKHSLHLGEGFIKNFCGSVRKSATNVINFERKKMLALLKKTSKYTRTQQHVTYLLEKCFLKKFETIAILQVNPKVQHIVYEIESLIYQMKFLYFSTMGQTMIIVLS